MILLDTHIWIWSVDKNPRLKRSHELLIEGAQEEVFVSIVSFWEIVLLVAKKRLDLGLPPKEWLTKVQRESGISLLPLTTNIISDAYSLPGHFHDDPADRMIVATARNRDCLLLTEDEKILKYPHVRTP